MFQKKDVKPKSLYTSDDFAVGSRQTVRIYRGRTTENPGQMVAEGNVVIAEHGMDIPVELLEPFVDPITQQFLPGGELTFWLVAPDGAEHYAFTAEPSATEPPPLLIATDYVH